MPHRIKNNALIIIQLCLMVLLGRVAFDIYLPALPHLAHQFQSSSDQISLTISLFSVGFGLSQLVYGPLSDRYGRRCVALSGFVIFILGSLMASTVQSVVGLCWARFIMGCGAGVGVVISRAIARDLYVEHALAKVCAMQSLMLTLGLFLAPLMGAYLLALFGWRSQFLTLTFFGLLCLVFFIYQLPETNKTRVRGNLFILSARQYAHLLFDRSFIVFALIVGCAFAGLVAYFQLSTFIFQHQFKLSAVSYGWVSLVVVVAYVMGTLSLRHALKTKTLYQVIKKGVSFMLFGSLVLLGACYLGEVSLSIILYATMLYVYGLRLIMPSATALCLTQYSRCAGTAAALLGSVIMLVAALVSTLIGLLSAQSVLVLGVCYLGLAVVSGVLSMSMSPKDSAFQSS